MTASKRADLVLSGGGVKGIGLVGSVVALMDAGYTIQRVSGTSAGSLVGAIVAAAVQDGHVTGAQLRELALEIDYRKFLDPGPIESVPLLGPAWGVLRGTGIYRGDNLHDWIRDQLERLGVSTFGDLAISDNNLPEEQRYRLVVTVADITTGQLIRLPWDYQRVYGLDPDEQSVADAVRASTAIPFFYRPATLKSTTGQKSTLVDGGLLSNFPIDSLDRMDGKRPRWPSFGVTLMPNLPEGDDQVIPALKPLHMLGPPTLLECVLTTILVGRDQAYLNQPWVSARTIRVDSADVGVFEFDLSRQDKEALYGEGYAAAREFLSTWDWSAYVERFR
jgi:NTE family protein